MTSDATVMRKSVLSVLLEFVHRRPFAAVAVVLTIHLIAWTAIPILASPNLQLDLAEGLALGKEWQLGYWKHPPLPWWITDLIYQVTGKVDAVYALGPLASTICMLAVWLLARDVTGPVQALIATLALEGIHFYNISAVKFAHDQMQLPVWAVTALFLYCAIVGGRAHYWVLAGVMLALAFWTKYSAIAFAASLGLFLLFDPEARRSWLTPGPYLMGLAFMVVIAPHVVWLITQDFGPNDYGPLLYANARARVAEHWHEYLTFPMRWIASQLFFLVPAIGLLALAYRSPKFASRAGLSFAGRYVTMLAFGPFLFVTLVALVSGRLPIFMWGYPLWSFLPLAAVVWLGPDIDTTRQRMFAVGFLAIFVLMPLSFVAAPIAESLFRDRIKATDFPGQVLAEKLTQIWRTKVNAPLKYVTGDEHAANNIAVFSPDRPHVIMHGLPKRSPWVDMNDLRRSGLLITWAEGGAAPLHWWTGSFADFDPAVSEVIELPRHGSRAKPPLRMRYAIIPPK